MRAARLSDALDTSLHVVLALPTRDERLFRAQVSYLVRLLEAVRPQGGHELEVVHGTAGDAGMAAARERDPRVVVVDAGVGTRDACRLVDELGVPVFVARDPRATGARIAVGDLLSRRPESGTADELLARARERDDDVVVVGHPPSSWLTRLTGDRTAERVVRRCARSVMVVPAPGG